jgi:predicted ATPase
MTEKEIQDFHDILFQYLLNLHEQDNSLLFQVRRSNKLDRQRGGYWFNGSDNYIETSFWGYSADTYQTHTMMLFFEFKNAKWIFELNASESGKKSAKDKTEIEERRFYLEKMAETLGGFTKEKNHIWHKEVSQKEFIAGLNDFIKQEKLIIDKYIKDNPPKENIKIGFIQPKDFDKQVKKIINTRESKEPLEGTLKQHIKDLFVTNVALPFAITRLYVENYQGIKKLVSEDSEGNGIEPNTQWIFLTGENGFGKTSILRAIAKGLIGDEDEVPNMPNGNAVILINGIQNSMPFFDKIVYRSTPKNLIPVTAYGVSRFLISSSNTDIEERSKRRTYSLFRDDGLLINIEKELIITKTYNEPRFNALKKVLEQILYDKISINIDVSNGSPKVKYTEKATEWEENKAYESVSLQDLAAGYRSILTMVGDMLLRFLSTNSSDLDSIAGIALIDEIDAHLHPKYQYELPNLLSKAFPKVQFIVTTHSPIPLLGLGENNKSVIFKVNRTIEEGITMDRLDNNIPFRQMLPNSLLSSPIFGFESIFPRNTETKDIITEDNWNEIEDTRNIQEEILKLRKEGLL